MSRFQHCLRRPSEDGPGQRRGAALVLALVVLVMLMMLGVPFLMNQSVGLSGSVSHEARQDAVNTRETAHSLGIALAAPATSLHLLDPTRPYSALPEDMRVHWVGEGFTSASEAFIQDNIADTSQAPRLPHVVDVRAEGLAPDLPYNELPAVLPLATYVSNLGLSLEDESGKLDVNTMDVAQWHKLLAEQGIIDWDDNAADDSDDIGGGDEAGDTDGNGNPDDDGDGLPENHDGDDGDDWGELAEALARFRYSLPGNRITHLDELLDADPGHNDEEPKVSSDPGYNYGVIGTTTGSWGFRSNLTAAELEQLRPFLTVHSTAQARGGVVDVGTVIGRHQWDPMSPHLPIPVLDSDISDLVKPGTHLVAQLPDTVGLFPFAWTSSGLWTSEWAGSNPRNLVVGDPVGLELPARINLNVAGEALRRLLWDMPSAPDATQVDLTGLTALTLKDASTVNIHGHLNPLFTDREQAALAIRSWNLITVRSGGATLNHRGQPVSEISNLSVVQAVDQEEPLGLRWETQADWHLLQMDRTTSRMTTWPEPMLRLPDLDPDTSSWTAVGPDAPGIRPAPLPSIATIARTDLPRSLRWDWRVTFSHASDAAKFLYADYEDGGLQETAELTASLALDELKPDGLYPASSAPAWRVDDSKAGPLRSFGNLADHDDEIDGRHLSLWFKPTAAWDIAGGERTILDLGGMAANQLPDWTGSPFDAATMPIAQNRLRVYYDPVLNYLVLELANAAIEHRSVYGRAIPTDDFLTALTDETSYGSTAGFNDLAPVPTSPGLSRTVKHWYKIVGGLQAERWYHLQLVIAHDRPGGQAMLLDGLAGRDATRLPADEALRTGDHQTTPVMILDEDLAQIPYARSNPFDAGEPPALSDPTFPAAGGGKLLQRATIALRATNILADLTGDVGTVAEKLLPAQGHVRIGNEYISYTGISGNTLQGCVRAERQNQNQGSSTETERWPSTEAHLTGALVVPVGMRFRAPVGSQLYQGGTSSSYVLGNGDTGNPDGAKAYRLWAEPSTNLGDYAINDPLAGTVTIDNTTTQLRVRPGGFLTDLPPTGVIRIRLPSGQVKYYWYSGYAGGIFSVEAWTPADTASWEVSQDSLTWRVSSDDPLIYVVGLAVDDSAIIDQPTHFRQTGGHDFLLLQIEDPSDGRIEWLHYDAAKHWTSAGGTTVRTFINADGWGIGSRGQQRTAFAGADTILTPSHTFPADSLVLPVQTAVTGAHVLAAGDIVTIVPDEMNPAAVETLPHQNLVRYTANDGFPQDWQDDTFADTWDTKDQWFAFARPLPHAWEQTGTAGFDLQIGTGWHGDDLSALDANGGQRSGLMPRLQGMAVGMDPAANPAALYIGGESTGALDIAIDAIATAEQPGSTVGQNRLGVIVDFKDAGGSSQIAVDSTETGFAIETDVGVLPSGLANATRGLIQVGGEVMAYRWDSATADARIVARGLLGSAARPHILGDYLPVLHLPVGPVLQLDALLSPDHQATAAVPTNPVPLDMPIGGSGLKASLMPMFREPSPAFLLSAGDGSALELMQAVLSPDGNTLYTAPWLRGLYHSTPRSFAAGDLLIGHWPRFASHLPATSSSAWPGVSNVKDRSAMLACRNFAWFGIGVRLRDLAFGEIGAVALDGDDSGPCPVELVGRAMPLIHSPTAGGTGSITWQQWGSGEVLEVDGSGIDTVFSGELFRNTVSGIPRPRDGVELRFFYRYTDSPSSGDYSGGDPTSFFTATGLRGNSSPQLGFVSMAFQAPNLSVQRQWERAGPTAAERSLEFVHPTGGIGDQTYYP